MPEQIAESDAEKRVTQHVCSGHWSCMNGIDQERSVDKLRLARNDNIDEERQLFGNRRQVGIEDHQDIACRCVETSPDVSRLTDSGPCLRRMFFSGFNDCTRNTSSAVPSVDLSSQEINLFPPAKGG